MSNKKTANDQMFATGEIDERDLDHVSGGATALLSMQEMIEPTAKVSSLKLLKALNALDGV